MEQKCTPDDMGGLGVGAPRNFPQGIMVNTAYISNTEVYTSLNFSNKKDTPRYLKYWQFSEAFFSMGPPCLRKKLREMA